MKKKTNVVNHITIISIIVFVLVLFLSISWASFNASMHLESFAMIRIKSDIRVTGFHNTTTTNGGVSVNEEYNVNRVSGTIILPNNNSTVTYSIEITNMEIPINTYMGVNSLTGLPSNLKIVSINDYTLKDKICDDNNQADCGPGAQKNFYITIGYKNDASYDINNTTFDFVINFEFKKVFNIEYNGFSNPPSNPVTVIDGDRPTIIFSDDAGVLSVVSGGVSLVLGTDYSYSNHVLTFLTPIRDHIYINNHVVYTISYELNGGTQANNQVTSYTITNNQPILSPTKTGNIFGGWYLSSDFSGNDITNTSELNGNVTLYASWVNQKARIGGTYYDTLSLAVEAVDNDNREVTIELLANTSEVIIVDEGKNIRFDLKDHTLSNSGVNPVISNSGRITIMNGTISSNTTQGVINNNSHGVMIITGGTIEAKGSKQAIYNGGSVTISGTTLLTSTSSVRATVQNLNTGSLSIIGGTIISTGQAAVLNAGILNIGVEGSGVNTTSPAIRGETYGIVASSSFNYYDGRISGKNAAIDNEANINEMEDDYQLLHTNESISGSSFKTIYLVHAICQIEFNPMGGIIEEMIREVESGMAVGVLPTPIKTGFVFEGWFDDDHDGHKIDANEMINYNITFYAHWIIENQYMVARIGNSEYVSLDAAWETITTNTPTTIEILRDISLTEKYTITSTKNIIIDLQDHTITTSVGTIFENYGTLLIQDTISNGSLIGGMVSSGNQIPVIVNKSSGIVTISGGSISSDVSQVIDNSGTMNITGGTISIGNYNQGVINNNTGAILNMSGGMVIANIPGSRRQAIYNKGTVYISGTAILTSASTDRATLHNDTSSAKAYISGGTITSTNSFCQRGAIQNTAGATLEITGGTIISSSTNSSSGAIQNAGTLTIGKKDGIINNSVPDLQGETYGVNNSGTFNFYDGILKGKIKAVNGNISEIDSVGSIVDTQTTINGDTYYVSYLNRD